MRDLAAHASPFAIVTGVFVRVIEHALSRKTLASRGSDADLSLGLDGGQPSWPALAAPGARPMPVVANGGRLKRRAPCLAPGRCPPGSTLISERKHQWPE